MPMEELPDPEQHVPPPPPPPQHVPESPEGEGAGYPRECLDCGRSFPNSTRYHKHRQTHDLGRSCPCKFPGCGKVFKRKTHLDRHILSHQEGPKPFRCTADCCSKSFLTQQKLDRHTKSVHNGLKCQDCGQRFRKKDKLDRHRKLVHKSGSRSSASSEEPGGEARPHFKCKECQRSFASVEHLERHIRQSHSKLKLHRCKQCAESFGTFKELVAHRRQAHARSYACETCGKCYANASHLREHKQAVHEQAVVMCQHPGCHLSFATKKSMRSHFRVKHLNLQEFKCRYCDKVFGYKNVLRNHYQKVHGGASPSPERLPKFLADVRHAKLPKKDPLQLLTELFEEAPPSAERDLPVGVVS
eukprot:TRINITY_DN63883_c0_g1_i1.p1 TRINITY_DN63883_c0_g1~~TRINITY_DN63883_c0_g1_i1.p1  ORF type:complete len:358 (-),score=55.85 TRINITY_DN63883_c0_g1_i1:84-1157(-)